MRIAKTCIQFIDKVKRGLDELISKAISEEKSKLYQSVLTEIKSFIRNVENFMITLKNLEEYYPSLSSGRVCFRWIYSENNGILSIVKLEPRFSIVYAGDYLRISYNDRSVAIHGPTRISITVNQYKDDIDLTNEDDSVVKRSLILDAISEISKQLEKDVEIINICTKYARRRA